MCSKAWQAPLHDPVCFVACKERGNWRSFAVGGTAAQRCDTSAESRGEGRAAPVLQVWSCSLSRPLQSLSCGSKDRQCLHDIRDISAKSLISGIDGGKQWENGFLQGPKEGRMDTFLSRRNSGGWVERIGVEA